MLSVSVCFLLIGRYDPDSYDTSELFVETEADEQSIEHVIRSRDI